MVKSAEAAMGEHSGTRSKKVFQVELKILEQPQPELPLKKSKDKKKSKKSKGKKRKVWSKPCVVSESD
jgi:hypothetical protein